MAFAFLKKWFSAPPAPAIPTTLPVELQTLFESAQAEGNRLSGTWQGRAAALEWGKDSASGPVFQLACGSDLWCRKMQSVTTMLDPALFESYTTGDDRIDEKWIVQSNPPFAFRQDQKEGCDALFALLQQDSGLHATHDWLIFRPGPKATWTRPEVETYFKTMQQVVATAERELKPLAR